MTSKEMDKKTVQCSATLDSLNIDDKLTDLSCPFTWGMQDVVENRNKLLDADKDRLDTVADIQDHFPEFIFIYHLMLAYENVMSNDLPTAMECINKAELSLDDLKQKASLENLQNVLEHVFVATKCHVLQKLEQRMTEVDELLEGICDIDDMNDAESAMLSGCQCLAWSLYYTTDNLMAIECAKKAIEYEPANGRWYFLVGKNYRRLRRKHLSLGRKPSPQESTAFEKAFDLDANDLFGVSLAQCYRESFNYLMANQIYHKIYELNPTCCKVRLQLALGFIRAGENTLAKECLDYVAEKMPTHNIYTHYMAIYEEKCNRNFKAALPYYQLTTEKFNFRAEWQYVQCRKKVERNWDPLPYMLTLLEKYDKYSAQVAQQINIRIGSYYLFEKNDILSACPHLIKAIKISPDAKLLKEHFLLFRPASKVNIYDALIKEIQCALKNGAATYNHVEIALLNDTLQLCRKNCGDSSSTSSPISSSFSNYGRGSSSRAGISYRQERSSSSVQGWPRNYP